MKYDKNKKSTKLNYHGIWSNFNKFLVKLDTIPKTWEHRVCLYCSYLVYHCGIKSSTLKSYVSAIKYTLEADGYSWNLDKVLLASFAKTCQSLNDVVKTRLPIGGGLLEIILFEVERKYRQHQYYLEIMYKHLFSIAYHGLFRIGELTSGSHPIKAKDVHISDEKDKMLFILYSSKTHGIESRPQEIKISGKTCSNKLDIGQKYFCPFKLGREYQTIRSGYYHKSDPYFVFSDGSFVRPRHVRTVLRQILRSLNLNDKLYDTHSFRIGRATDLLKFKSVEEIKRLGRWKSNAVYKYLR